MTGMAVSVQRLERISPSRWSGQKRDLNRTMASCIGYLTCVRTCGTRRRTERRRRSGDYFFRSLRFQQVDSTEAFAFVIGTSVV